MLSFAAVRRSLMALRVIRGAATLRVAIGVTTDKGQPEPRPQTAGSAIARQPSIYNRVGSRHSTARWSSRVLLSDLILHGFHAAATSDLQPTWLA